MRILRLVCAVALLAIVAADAEAGFFQRLRDRREGGGGIFPIFRHHRGGGGCASCGG